MSKEYMSNKAAIEQNANKGLSTGYLLSRAGRIIHEKFEKAIEPTGLHARHFGLLVCLNSFESLSQGEAAQRMSIDKSTVVAIVDDLEEWNLIERKRNTKDRRYYKLSLTKDGVKKLFEVVSTVEGLEKEWLKPLNENEQEHFHALLSRLLFSTDGMLSNL